MAKELIQTCHRGLLIAETNSWRDKILVIHTEHISTYTRYGFSLDSLDITHVQTLSKIIPENYHILQVDESLVPQIIDDVAYENTDTFLKHGIGFCAMHDDQIASAALAYTNSNNGIEVQIYTEDKHERKGLATATGATLIAHCLKNNIAPHWSAANQTSAHLAQKLGYTQNDAYVAIIYRKP